MYEYKWYLCAIACCCCPNAANVWHSKKRFSPNARCWVATQPPARPGHRPTKYFCANTKQEPEDFGPGLLLLSSPRETLIFSLLFGTADSHPQFPAPIHFTAMQNNELLNSCHMCVYVSWVLDPGRWEKLFNITRLRRWGEPGWGVARS